MFGVWKPSAMTPFEAGIRGNSGRLHFDLGVWFDLRRSTWMGKRRVWIEMVSTGVFSGDDRQSRHSSFVVR